jgi:hypothetical protein
MLGIPVFMHSRGQVFASAGALSLIFYLTPFFCLYISIYSFYKVILCHKRFYILNIIVLFFFYLLDGSKSGILGLVYAYFFFSYFYLNKIVAIKKKYLLVIALFPLFVIMLNSGSGMNESINKLAFRLAASGDCYANAYPNDVIDHVKVGNSWSHLMSGILRPLRIVNYSEAEAQPLGTKILYQLDSSYELAGEKNAPNTRLPIAGWVYFRWYGICFSLFYGIVVSFLMFKSSRYFNKSIIGITCYSSVYMMVCSGIADHFILSARFVSCIISFCFSLIIMFFLSCITDSKSKNKYAYKCKMPQSINNNSVL